MIPSIDKTLHYLNSVSKRSYTATYEGCEYHFTPKSEFTIRPSMFYRDECQSCGQCCRNWDTIFFPMDMPELTRRSQAGEEQYTEYLEGCNEYSIDIDGRTYQYYSMPPMQKSESHGIWVKGHTVLNCRWIYLDGLKKYCRIHEYRCITCGFPHMELYMNHKETHGFLGHKQFGRNHQLCCPVQVKQDPIDRETLDSNIYWLERLKVVSDYFELDTYLPEILDYLKAVNLDKLPVVDVVFNKSSNATKLFNI